MLITGGFDTSFLSRMVRGGQQMLRNCVAYKSNLRYSSDWNRWRIFMRKCWEHCTEEMLYMQDMSTLQKVELLVGYGHYCLKEHRVDKNGDPDPLAACTINSSFAGIRHSFRSNILDDSFFDNRSLRAFKTAAVIEERKLAPDNKVVFRKFPMTLEMVNNITTAAEGSRVTKDLMCATAIQLAFFCLLRVSEYVADKKAQDEDQCHAMMAKDVLFELTLTNGTIKMLDATQVTAAMWPRVTLVKFTLRHAKNDQARIGSTFWFRNLESATGINIVKVAFDWAVYAKCTQKDVFMSHRRNTSSPEATCLDYDTVSNTIKNCALRFGFQREDFGTHSPRIGGACTLRAGDANETMVNLLGKWRGPTTSWIYQETSTLEFDRMQKIIRDPTLFTIKDIRLAYQKFAGALR